MLKLVALLLAGLLLSVGNAPVAGAAIVGYDGTLSFQFRDLTPLEPRYVSTVDSGNLVGALLVLAEGASDVAQTALVDPRGARGLADAVAVLDQHLREHPGALEAYDFGAVEALLTLAVWRYANTRGWLE